MAGELLESPPAAAVSSSKPEAALALTDPAGARQPSSGLAFTGASSVPLTLVAFGMLLAGLVLDRAVRTKRRSVR